MRLLPASLALLGVEVAMAALILPRNNDNNNDATPARARIAGQVPETGRIAAAEPTATATAANDLEKQLNILEAGTSALQYEYHQEAKRQVSTASGSAPLTTSLAFFTADAGVYSVSALADGDINVVAGKTLSVGGPYALVGGEEVSMAASGLYVNGVEVGFEAVTYSASVSSSSSVAMGTSSMAGTSSAAVESASQSSSEDAAVARATAGVVAAVGAVVGVLVL